MSRYRLLHSFSATMACLVLSLSSPSLWAQSHSVAPGLEFYEILSGTNWSDVPFIGIPFGSAGDLDGDFAGVDLGTTAMAVQRNNFVTGAPNDTQNATFEIISLQAVSAFPVEWNGGALDSYFLTLQSDRNVGEGTGLVSTGTHALTFGEYPEVNSKTGMHGTLRSFFTLALDVRRGGLDGPIVDSGSVFFQTSNPNTPNEISWSHFPEGNDDDTAVTVAGVNYRLDGSSQDQDFFMEGPITQRLSPTLYFDNEPGSLMFQWVIENGAVIGGGGSGGSSPSNPLLPDFGGDGFFGFEFEVGDEGLGLDEPMFIDPVYAIGYEYSINDSSSPLFASVLIPEPLGGGDADFLLEVNGNYFDIVAGEQMFFADLGYFDGVDLFRILGIDLDEMLDPENPTAFVTGLTFSSGGQVAMTMSAITVDVAVPEPGSLLLALAIPLAISVLRRR